MAREIERKFLVAGDGWRSTVSKAADIEQAYLAVTDVVSVRVRIVDGQAARITIKSRSAGRSRLEFEYAVPVEDAREMLALRTGNTIAKRRHELTSNGRTWEVDIFGGPLAGLVLAECELESEDAEVSLPEWLGAEVTADARYYNDALSVHGVPPAG